MYVPRKMEMLGDMPTRGVFNTNAILRFWFCLLLQLAENRTTTEPQTQRDDLV